MVTLYHLNHSCHDCVPDHIFDLLPIRIEPGSEFAGDYEEWQRAFPGGLSVFGFRHMTPDQPFGEVPLAKAELELRCEFVRRKHFGNKRSRFQSFFALATLEEAVAFRDKTKLETGMNGSIWEIRAATVHHRGDMRLHMPDQSSEADLIAYWEGKERGDGNPVWECLVVPPVTMVRCLVEADVSPGPPP
jgi:hypothetical protein